FHCTRTQAVSLFYLANLLHLHCKFVTLSTYTYNFDLDIRWILGALVALFGLSIVFSSLLSLIIVMELQNDKKLDSRLIKLFWTGFLGLLIVWLLVLLSIWPGSLTYDSYTQWGQANGYYALSNWHPIFHTLLIKLCSLLYLSPASYLVFQIILGSFSVSWVVYRLCRRGLPFWLGICTLIGYAIYPLNGIYMSTVWKDIPYSIMLLLLFYLVAEIVQDGEINRLSWAKILALTCLLICTALIRKNGLYVVLIVAAYLLIFKRSLKTFVAVVVTLFGIFGFNYVTDAVYHVAKSPTTEMMAVPLQQIGATYAHNGNISQKNQKYFAQILPANEWKERYNPYTADNLKFSPNFKGYIINENAGDFLKHWFELLKHNKVRFIMAYAELSAVLWKYNLPSNEVNGLMGGGEHPRIQPNDEMHVKQYMQVRNNPQKYLRPLYESNDNIRKSNGQNTISYSTFVHRYLTANKSLLYDSKIPIGNKIVKHIFVSIQEKYVRILASGALALLVTLLALCVAIEKIGFWKSIAMFLVPAINFLTLAISAPAPVYRYVYSLSFSSWLIMLFVVTLKSKRTDTK
uniref:DUF6020 family protein n=1 Tax=Lacticaseibacillus hulanensis TaxID=2493111 RepID=UPI0019D41975